MSIESAINNNYTIKQRWTKHGISEKEVVFCVLLFGLSASSFAESEVLENASSSSDSGFRYLNATDESIVSYPDSIAVYPPQISPKPTYVADGPPQPSENASGSLSIGLIHNDLHRIYDECTLETNNAFSGITPDPGVRDTTHEHIHQGSTRLKSRNNWRCGGYRMGVNDQYEDILKYRCDSVVVAAEESCTLSEHERIDEEGYFQCENERENFVKLSNYFFYNLEFNSTLNISRNLYQTAEIRVYCDREGGWESSASGPLTLGLGSALNIVKAGRIKVVQLAPFSRYGGAGLAEELIPTVEGKVLKGLREHYMGKVAKMQHIIDVAGFSGSRCSSLGVDGDASMPLASRSIVWDVPPPEPVFTDQ